MADSTVLVTTPVSESDETTRAQALARRYRCEFVDLKNFRIQHDLFRTVPVDLMFRYNFVPIEQRKTRWSSPSAIPAASWCSTRSPACSAQRIITRVATLSQITDLLKKTEQSQRVLDEATEGLTFDVVAGDDNPDENISIEKLTARRGHQPHHPAGRHHHLHRARTPRLRHPHRNLRRLAAWSSTASTACCRRPWRPSRASTTPPSFPASRS